MSVKKKKVSKTTRSSNDFGFGPWALSDSTTAAMRALQRSAIESNDNRTSGVQGKEGLTKLYTIDGIEYAIKLFKKRKSADKLKTEFDLQNEAAQVGVAPEAYYFDPKQKFIVMRKLKSTILEALDEREPRRLSREEEDRVIDIFHKLDEAGIMQNDGNPRNLMLDFDNKIYVIDFGFAKRVTAASRKKWGEHPNTPTSLWMFSSQLNKHNCPTPVMTAHVNAYNRTRNKKKSKK